MIFFWYMNWKSLIQGHLLCSFILWVVQVRRWTPVDIGFQELPGIYEYFRLDHILVGPYDRLQGKTSSRKQSNFNLLSSVYVRVDFTGNYIFTTFLNI